MRWIVAGFFVCCSLAVLAGCQTQSERLGGICKSYGHKPGTAGYNQCVAQERKIHHARVDAADAALAASRKNSVLCAYPAIC